MAKKTVSTKKEFKISDLNEFLSGVNEQGGLIEDVGDINTKEFITTGIYILDAALSTKLLDGGIPNNKVIGIGGASGVGKSFLALNIAKGAQTKDYFVVYLDSENAIDLPLVNKFGINPKQFRIDPIATVEDLKKYLAQLIKRLEEARDAKMEIPKIIIILDSLGNLASEKEVADAESGASKADMTRAKQLKSIFRIVTHKLGILGIPMVLTNHTYMCLTAGHEVLMGDGSYKEIQNITSGDFVQTLIGPKEVTNNVEFEDCPIIKIELESGEIIKCTPEHKFLVSEDWSDDETKSCWKSAKDLKDTDYILSID